MKKNLMRFAIVAVMILVVASVLVAAESYFNWQEINALVEGANARGLDYELTITNELTNDYIFETKAS
ncbi:hypothetical protein [Macrococcus capreoli]|uniref:hypothetical protein n=1 Tax=Macrococcus capreoli TaxID=2982690 RepID=UPI0021D56CC2|nr:hypothetical protein [Macrococcus sp. TMW 2.2395]MCU7557087.1 hypothetical protein [Macrococcus sp. TMW 2.2395]